MSGSPSILVIGVAILALASALLGMVYLIYRLRLRRRQLRLELSTSADLVEDRAFNQIRIARSEADILDRTGIDVHKPRDTLTRAQQRFDLRDYAEALSLAKSAHDTLVRLRTQGAPRLPANPVPSTSDPAGAGDEVAPGIYDAAPPRDRDEAVSPPPAPKLAKNRVESHFQMRLLDGEVERARAAASPSESLPATLELQGQSRDAYTAGEYTEALRIALKARRTLGAQLETLPAPKAARASSSPAMGAVPPGSSLPSSPSAPCPNCGRDLSSADRFCRGCGTPRNAAACPRCGLAAQPSDTFCGSCGSPLPSG
ncbi:MAG: zinc ribbon domain-containing protein [Thermoplasmata archaeon]